MMEPLRRPKHTACSYLHHCSRCLPCHSRSSSRRGVAVAQVDDRSMKRFLLTLKKEFCMLPVEKSWYATKLSIFFKPQKFALQKGTVEHTSQSPACGAFLFPSDSISHNRDFSQVHLSAGKRLQTNCNVQFSFSERRTKMGQRPTPDDLDLHQFQKSNPPNANIFNRDGSVRKARLTFSRILRSANFLQS
jgi:hypothetical protein